MTDDEKDREIERLRTALKETEKAAEDIRNKNVALLDENKRLRRMVDDLYYPTGVPVDE